MARGNKVKKKHSYRNNGYKNNSYQAHTSYNYRTFSLDEEQLKKTKKKGKKKNKNKAKIKYVYSDIPGFKIPLSLYTTVIVIFLCALVVSMSFANVSLQRRTNQQLANQLRQMENETNGLSIEISETRNLEEIAHLARTRLDMSEPNPFQTIYIELPEQAHDNTLILEPTVVEESLGEKIRNILLRLRKILSEEWLYGN